MPSYLLSFVQPNRTIKRPHIPDDPFGLNAEHNPLNKEIVLYHPVELLLSLTQSPPDPQIYKISNIFFCAPPNSFNLIRQRAAVVI